MRLGTDKNIRYQQNPSGRKIPPVILGNRQGPLVKQHLDKMDATVNTCTPFSYAEVEFSSDQIPIKV